MNSVSLSGWKKLAYPGPCKGHQLQVLEASLGESAQTALGCCFSFHWKTAPWSAASKLCNNCHCTGLSVSNHEADMASSAGQTQGGCLPHLVSPLLACEGRESQSVRDLRLRNSPMCPSVGSNRSSPKSGQESPPKEASPGPNLPGIIVCALAAMSMHMSLCLSGVRVSVHPV